MAVTMLPSSSSTLSASRSVTHKPRRLATSTHSVIANATKGFGSGDSDKPQASNLKVSERGKIASRPGPISMKDAKKRQAEEQAQSQTEPTPLVSSDSEASTSSSEPQRLRVPQRSSSGTPEVVANRIFTRMLTFTGIPILTGLLLFPVFIYLKSIDEDFPIWVVYIAQTLAWGGGLLGITYGALSASWDSSREGSFWGWTEFQANLPILLNRNKNE